MAGEGGDYRLLRRASSLHPSAIPLNQRTSFNCWLKSGLISMGLTPFAAYARNLNALASTWPWLKSMAYEEECGGG